MIFKNFFFFNYFNFFFFNYFNFIFFFFNKNNFFFFSTQYYINNFLDLKKFDLNKKNFFFIKFYKFFFISRQSDNYLNVSNFVKFNKNNLIYFNPVVFYFIKFFNKFLINFFKDENKFLILDSLYKNNFFLYNKIFNLKDMINYNYFFFPKPNYFCRKNWVFFFKFFCKFFDISIFFIKDFKYFAPYFNELSNLEIPTVAILPSNYKNNQVDYSIFCDNTNSFFIKYLFFLSISNCFFLNLNFKFFLYKFNYFNSFIKIIKIN